MGQDAPNDESSGQRVEFPLLGLALDAIDERIFVFDGDSPRFAYVNAAAASGLGYTVDELVGGMTVFDIDPRLTPEAWEAIIRDRARSPRGTIETQHRHRDKTLFPVEATGYDFKHQGRFHHLAIVRDLRERKAAEQSLLRSEKAYRSLVENTPDLVVRWTPDLVRVLVNGATARVLGATPEALIGERLGSHLVYGLRPNLDALEQAIRRVFASGGGETLEVSLEAAEGPRSIQLRLVAEQDEHGAVRTVLGIGRDITQLKQTERFLRSLTESLPDVVLRFSRGGALQFFNSEWERLQARVIGAEERLLGELRDGIARLGSEHATAPVRLRLEAETLHFEARFVPEPSETVLVLVRDVTEQHRLREQFLQAQKMEAVGRLAGGIAHDFNNMLTVIQMQVAMLLQDAGDPGTAAGLSEIKTSADRASALTRQLLVFSRRRPTQLGPLDWRESIQGTARLLTRVLGEDVVLETQLMPVPPIHADPGSIEQVAMNLAVNARDAMPHGGLLTLALDVIEVAAPPPPARPGAFVRLTVKDTGTGISSDVLPQIFEPFFTTKDIDRGTGLGLSTVREIVQQHGGFVTVASEVSVGTSFRVHLPVWEGPSKPAEPRAGDPAPRGHETVLLVEDDRAVREATKTALERLGYRVIVAGGGAAARALWRDHHASIDLLLTDLVMPVESGLQLASALRADRPNLPVLLATGHRPEVEALEALGARAQLVHKPYSLTDLGGAVRRLLDDLR